MPEVDGVEDIGVADCGDDNDLFADTGEIDVVELRVWDDNVRGLILNSCVEMLLL